MCIRDRGLLGPIPKHNFYLLANKGWIDFLGTDAHNAFSIYLMQNIIELNIVQKTLPRILNYYL